MRFGDNDRLSAIVATLVSADALVLLSDVDGLYNKNPSDPSAKLLDEVRSGNDLTDVEAGDGGVFGTGGMAAKVSAARLATRGGTSLLAVGITGIEGEFHAGDIVEILGPDSEAVGRGEVAYDAAELAAMCGRHSDELPTHQRRAVVHADYLSNYASRLQ